MRDSNRTLYTFVKVEDKNLQIVYSWLLLATDIDEIIEHHKIFVGKEIEKGIIDYAENVKRYSHYTTTWAAYGDILASTKGTSFINAISNLEKDMLMAKFEALNTYNAILIGEKGNFMPYDESRYIILKKEYKKQLVYPVKQNISEKDIEITQWKDGWHYYAKVAGKDVVIDGKQSWDTYDDAFTAALKYIKQLNASKTDRRL